MISLSTECEEFWNGKNGADDVLLLYGAGINAEFIILELLQKTDIKIDGFIDNAKKGHLFNGYQIYAPEEIDKVFAGKNVKIFVTIKDVFGAITALERHVNGAKVYIPVMEGKESSINLAVKSLRNRLIKDKSFTIVSNTCVAARLYQLTDCKYNSPFIAVIIKPDDYVKLCKNLKKYMEYELKFLRYEEWMLMNEYYTLCSLGDIEIKFIAQTPFETVKANWDRRKTRINYENLFLIYDNTHYPATGELYKEFLNSPYGTKLILQRQPVASVECSLMTDRSVHPFNPVCLMERWFKLTDFLNHEIKY